MSRPGRFELIGVLLLLAFTTIRILWKTVRVLLAIGFSIYGAAVLFGYASPSPSEVAAIACIALGTAML